MRPAEPAGASARPLAAASSDTKDARRTRRFGLHAGAAAAAKTLLANVLILVLNVGTGIITARALGPDGRGELAAMVLWPQFLAYALTLGIPTALLYNLKRRPSEERAGLFSVALVAGTGAGLVATLAGILLIPLWLTNYSEEVVRLAQGLMPLSPILLLVLICTHALQAREEFGRYNLVRYLHPAMTLLALAALALWGHLTPFTATLSYVLPAVPVFLWLTVHLWRVYGPAWKGLSWPAFGRMRSYGLRSYGVELLGPTSSQLDRVLVVGLLDPALAGLYVVAYSLSRALVAFQTAVVAVLFTRAAGRPAQEVVEVSGRAARVATSAAALSAATLAVLGPWLLGLVYGQGFVDAVPVFRLLLLEVVLGGAAWVLAQTYMVLDRPGVVSAIQTVGVGLSVVLMLVLAPVYGLEGAGIALLAATAVRLTLVVASFPLLLGVRPPGFLPRPDDFRKMIRRSRPSGADGGTGA